MNRNRRLRGIGAQGKGLVDRNDRDHPIELDGEEMMAKEFRKMCTKGDNVPGPSEKPTEAGVFQRRDNHDINYANYDGPIPPQQGGQEQQIRGSHQEKKLQKHN